jgi:hypothetical protein
MKTPSLQSSMNPGNCCITASTRPEKQICELLTTL